MKAKMEQYKKESTEDLNTILGAEGTSATEKAAIRQVLKERVKSEGDSQLKVVGDKNKASAKKAPAKKEETKKPAVKKVGVIATIFNAISAKEVTEAQILAKLKKSFPEKVDTSMMNTIRAQIGSNKRPVRMEKEKNVTFVINVSKKGVKSYSIKK